VPSGSTPLPARGANSARRVRPTGPMVREASTRLAADKNRTVTSAQLLTVPPSPADSQ
jgi:hypothetical protein